MLGLLRDRLIQVAHAQPVNLKPTSPDWGSYCNTFFTDGGFWRPAGSSGFVCFGLFVGNIAFVVIAFSATISLIMLIINGFRYMIGPAIPGGSSDSAKKGIGAALLGVCLSLLSYIILDTLIYSVTQ